MGIIKIKCKENSLRHSQLPFSPKSHLLWTLLTELQPLISSLRYRWSSSVVAEVEVVVVAKRDGKSGLPRKRISAMEMLIARLSFKPLLMPQMDAVSAKKSTRL